MKTNLNFFETNWIFIFIFRKFYEKKEGLTHFLLGGLHFHSLLLLSKPLVVVITSSWIFYTKLGSLYNLFISTVKLLNI